MDQTSSDTAFPRRGAASRDGTTLGTLTMITGAMFVLGALVSIATEWAWLAMLVGFALLVYVVPQLHRVQAPADGWPGRLGAPLTAAGAAIVLLLGIVFLVWDAVGDPGEPAWTGVLWMIGFFGFLVGIVLFGIGSMVANVVPRAAPLLMLLGLVAAIAIDMATGAFFEDEPATTEWGFYIGVPLFGVGLAWMGWALRTGRRARAAVRG
jgi:uncharacterized membrane protein